MKDPQTKVKPATARLEVTLTLRALSNDKPITPAWIERDVRKVLKDAYWGLDGKVTVRRIKDDSREPANTVLP